MSKKLIRQAKLQTLLSLHPTHHHGAIIVYGGKVLYRGTNKNDYCHAELDTLLECIKNEPLSKRRYMTLIVVRMNNSGILLNSKPCAMCSMIIKSSGINKVIYSSDNNQLITKLSSDLEEDHLTRAIIEKGGIDEHFIQKIKEKMK